MTSCGWSVLYFRTGLMDEPSRLLFAAEWKSKPRVLVSCVNWPVRRRGPFFPPAWMKRNGWRQTYMSSIQIKELRFGSRWTRKITTPQSSRVGRTVIPLFLSTLCSDVSLFITTFDTWSKPERFKRHLRVWRDGDLPCLGLSEVVKGCLLIGEK